MNFINSAIHLALIKPSVVENVSKDPEKETVQRRKKYLGQGIYVRLGT